MASIDWTIAGRSESFAFETLPNTTKDIVNDKSTGTINDVVSCTLNWSYESSDKVSGEIEVKRLNTNDLNNKLVRVYYKPSLQTSSGTVEKKILLATMYAIATEGHYEDGMYSGRVELKSTLCRYSDDKLSKDVTIAKGKTTKQMYDKIIDDYGGWKNWNGASVITFQKNRVIEFGETVMEYLQKSVSTSNRIDVDAYGRTRVRKYVTPSKRDESYTIPKGTKSVTLPGLDIERSAAGTPNRVALKYTYRPKNAKKDTVLYSIASVANEKTFSKKSTGRYITEAITVSELSKKTQEAINEKAKTELSSLTATFVKYTFECFYLPIHCGDVIRFSYNGLFSCKALVTNIDMTMEDCLKMRVTVKRVGS